MQSRIPGPSARAAAVSDTRSLTAMNRPAQTFGSLNKHSLLQCKSGSQKDLSDGLSQLPVMNGNIHLGSTTRHQHVSSVSQTRNPLPNKKQPTEKSSKQTPRQFNPSASPSLNDCQKALASGNEKGLSNANGVVEEFKYQSKFSKNARHHRPEISPSNREQDSSSEFAEVELCITETNGGGSTYSSPQMLHKQTRALSKTHQSMKKTSSRLPEGSQKEEKRASERISSTAKT
ncbi:neuron navigator 3-like [Callorhinchus milii]|uniref:neuron navigator 3-like n=1 Tax=Callorhinchus milii TaxID=7868 RepID=UPI001C3FD261|nr:neuron navigator 3-like [Callorhinchus milii]